jgi:hypothetical protein
MNIQKLMQILAIVQLVSQTVLDFLKSGGESKMSHGLIAQESMKAINRAVSEGKLPVEYLEDAERIVDAAVYGNPHVVLPPKENALR